jgi:hypothetical protein
MPTSRQPWTSRIRAWLGREAADWQPISRLGHWVATNGKFKSAVTAGAAAGLGAFGGWLAGDFSTFTILRSDPQLQQFGGWAVSGATASAGMIAGGGVKRLADAIQQRLVNPRAAMAQVPDEYRHYMKAAEHLTTTYHRSGVALRDVQNRNAKLEAAGRAAGIRSGATESLVKQMQDDPKAFERIRDDVIKGKTDAITKPAEEVSAIQKVDEARQNLRLRDFSAELEQATARRAELQHRIEDEGRTPALTEEHEKAIEVECELRGLQRAWNGDVPPEGALGGEARPELAAQAEQEANVEATVGNEKAATSDEPAAAGERPPSDVAKNPEAPSRGGRAAENGTSEPPSDLAANAPPRGERAVEGEAPAPLAEAAASPQAPPRDEHAAEQEPPEMDPKAMPLPSGERIAENERSASPSGVAVKPEPSRRVAENEVPTAPRDVETKSRAWMRGERAGGSQVPAPPADLEAKARSWMRGGEEAAKETPSPPASAKDKAPAQGVPSSVEGKARAWMSRQGAQDQGGTGSEPGRGAALGPARSGGRGEAG